MAKLTKKRIESTTKPGRYRDADTLYLMIRKSGRKSWVQRLVINGKRRDIGLGPWPLRSLEDARRLAMQNRLAVLDGGDPLAGKRRAKVPNFREAVEQTFEGLKPKWRNDKHASDWLTSVERYAFPVIGEYRVDQVSRADVLQILKPIWSSRPERARRLRQRIRAVLSWGQAHNYIPGENVAGECIKGALPSLPINKTHFRALPYQEVSAALETVEATGASLAAKYCLRFLVLTACRSGEARGAVWSEIDLKAREWCIPAERMKGNAEHRVPLSAVAVAVLEQARTLDDGSGLVFPSPLRRGRPLSPMSLTKLLRDTGLAERANVHGFRSSFRTWASEKTEAEHAVMELSLAHRVGSAVEQAYSRSDLLSKRRRLMNQWAAYLSGKRVGKVVNIQA